MAFNPWWLSHKTIRHSSSHVCKVHISNSLEHVLSLQQRYPSDFVALPAIIEWYTVHDMKSLNYSRLCANSFYSLPFMALRVIKNTPCKHLLVEDSDILFEFREGKDVYSHNCITVNHLI